jgi:lysophospholipase L1-like esterase
MTPTSLLTSRLAESAFTRVIAFGSSNTERRLAGMHWFDCFELACRHTYGPHLACINSGRGGDTTRDLLERFERDCLAYRPNLVFLTVGGNDSNPDRALGVVEYRRNLETIIARLRALDCAVALQTYYAVDVSGISEAHATMFFAMMDTVRAVSAASGCLLLDHLARWELLRTQAYDVYARLMQDPMHVNTLGNQVIGLDIARAFALSLPDDVYFREAYAVQALLDRLSAE